MRFFQILKNPKLNEQWTQWFAWFPVKCEMSDGGSAYVWMEPVERREAIWYGGVIWRYRELITANPEVGAPDSSKG